MATRKSRNEVSIDRVLSEIEEAQGRLRELRTNVALVEQKMLPATAVAIEAEGVHGSLTSAPEVALTEAELNAERSKREFVEQGRAEIARLEGEIAKAWAHVGGLSEDGGRSQASDPELQQQLGALERRHSLLSGLRGTFIEDAHDAIDAAITFNLQRIDALLAGALPAEEMRELAASWAWRDPAFQKALHDALDSPDHLLGARDYAEGSRSSWQAELDLLSKQITRRRAELELRQSEREFAEAEREREEAVARLAPVAEMSHG